MKLVIAEKPSVAQSLAAVLGAKEKKDGYMEGNGWLVSWCVGHLVEMAQPEAYGEQYAKWRYDDLPILPDQWKYEVAKDKKKQLDILRRLMNEKRVDSVVCATDAGREGELIFRLVYHQADCTKPILRLWIMLQRLMITAALINQPQILVADEATTAIDACNRVELMKELKSLCKEGMSILFVTHDLRAASYSDQLLIMNHGKIVESGETKSIIENPKQEYTEYLLNACQLERRELM